MQLYLVRHAESENNAKPLHARVEDPPLTTIGRMQAGHLANWLSSLAYDTLITSPVLRALETTRFVTDTTGQHVHVWADVFETGGIYSGYRDDAIEGGQGLGRSDVIRHVAYDQSMCTLDDSIVESGWWGGRQRETPEQAADRAAQVIDRLKWTFPKGQRVVAIIHADFKQALLQETISWNADPSQFGYLRNTGITKLDFDGDRWNLDWFNSVSHLPAKLITSKER